MKCLLIFVFWTIFISCVNAQSCLPDGISIGNIYRNPDITDEASGVIAEITVPGIISAEITAENLYLDLSGPENEKITISLTTAFENYEVNANSSQAPMPLVLNILLICVSKPESLIFQQQIIDINNHAPEFSQEQYVYRLPMPFPSGIEITQFNTEIIATDIDISNVLIDFNTDSEYFTITYVEVFHPLNKQHGCIIHAAQPLEFTGTTTFTITATDTGNPTKTASATVTIEIDDENSALQVPVFDQAFYEVDYIISDALDIAEVSIAITNADTADFTIEGGFANHFQWDYNDGVFNMWLAANFDEGIIEEGGYIPLVVTATVSELKFTRTVVILRFPEREITTTPCPTETTTIEPTCEPCTTLEPEPCPTETTTIAPTCEPCEECTTLEPEPCPTTTTPDTTTVAPTCEPCTTLEPEPCPTTTTPETTTVAPTCEPCEECTTLEPEPCPTTTPGTTESTTEPTECLPCTTTEWITTECINTPPDCSECPTTEPTDCSEYTTEFTCATTSIDCSTCPIDECSTTGTTESTTEPTECLPCTTTEWITTECINTPPDCSECPTTEPTDCSECTTEFTCATTSIDCSTCPIDECSTTDYSSTTDTTTACDCPEVTCSTPQPDCSQCTDEICSTTVSFSTDTTTVCPESDCSACSTTDICSETTTVSSIYPETECPEVCYKSTTEVTDCACPETDCPEVCEECTTVTDYTCPEASTIIVCPETDCPEVCDESSTVSTYTCPESSTSIVCPETDCPNVCDDTSTATSSSDFSSESSTTTIYSETTTSAICLETDCTEVHDTTTAVTSPSGPECPDCNCTTLEPIDAEIKFLDAPFVFTIKASETLSSLCMPASAISTIDESITYAVEGDVPPVLTIDPTTAILRNSGILSPGTFEFTVTATGRKSEKASSADVTVVVSPVEVTVDGPSMAYALLVRSIMENIELSVLIPLVEVEGVDYQFEIIDVFPPGGEDLFTASENGIECSALDRESSDFAGMSVAQYTLTVQLSTENMDNHFTEYKNSIFRINEPPSGASSRADTSQCVLVDSIKQNVNQMILTIIVEDDNDNAPVFNPTSMVIGYPGANLLSLVTPAYLVQVEATDADIGENAELAYLVNSPSVQIHSTTGVIYPTEGMANNGEDFTFTVSARDQNGNGRLSSNSLEIQVKMLEEEHISILTLRNSLLEDLDEKISEINSLADVNILMLEAFVLPTENPTRQLRAEGDNYLVLVAYALDKDNELISNTNLQELLKDIEDLSIESLPESSFYRLSDSSSNGGLIAGVVILAILLVLVLIGFFAFYYFKLRKNKPYKNMEDESEGNSSPYPYKKNTSRNSSKLGQNIDKIERRPTGILFSDPVVDAANISSPTLFAKRSSQAAASMETSERRLTGILLNGATGDTNTDDSNQPSSPPKERRKSVVFNSNVEQINIDTTQDNDNLGNSRL